MKDKSEPAPENRTVILIGLGAILVLALVLRLKHMGYFMPWFHYIDEIRTTRVSLHLLQERTLDPSFMVYPAFGFYLTSLVYFLAAGAGMIKDLLVNGAGPVLETFKNASYTDYSYIMLSRWVSLVFGIGSIACFYLLARLYLEARWALLAALLLALNSVHITFSANAKFDTINLFWFVAGYYTSVRYYREGGVKLVSAAAVCAALAFSVKYNFQVMAWLGFLIFLRGLKRGKGLKGFLTSSETWAGVAIMAAVAFLATPYTFIQLKKTLETYGFIFHHGGVISFYHSDSLAWWRDRYFYILSVVLPHLFSLPLVVTTFIGSFYHAKKRDIGDYYLLYNMLMFLVFYVAYSGDKRGGSCPYYLFLPVLPLAIIISLDLLQDLSQSRRKVASISGRLAIGFLIVWSLLRIDFYHNVFYSPYEKLGPWIYENLDRSDRALLISVYTPTPALGISEVRSIWPQNFSQKQVESFDPNVIIVDTWAIAGFRKFYRDLPVAPLADSYLDGSRGYREVKRIRADYWNHYYFAAIDPEHDVELVVLKKVPPGSR